MVLQENNLQIAIRETFSSDELIKELEANISVLTPKIKHLWDMKY